MIDSMNRSYVATGRQAMLKLHL